MSSVEAFQCTVSTTTGKAVRSAAQVTSNVASESMSRLAPFLLHLFPEFFLLLVQLARQRIDRDVVLSAELAPEYKAKIVLTGGIGD